MSRDFVRLASALVGSVLAASMSAGCSSGPLSTGRDGAVIDLDAGAIADAQSPSSDGAIAPATCFVADGIGGNGQALTVSEAVSTACSTAAVRGLSRQLVDELNCLQPGLMSSIAGIPRVDLGSAVFPYLQTEAAAGLRRVDTANGSIFVNSALRTLPQQYLLYRWYQTGRCGIGLAASPGRSNHESGLALDISDNATWRARMTSAGFQWLGASDPVHFDYVRGGADIRGLSVRAFQRLWNRNHPEDRIAEDGVYGPATEARIGRSPAEGFATGAVCGMPDPMPPPPPPPMPMPEPEPVIAALSLDWSVDAVGAYTFRVANAGSDLDRVEYVVGGALVGTATRGAGDFALTVGACADGRVVDVVATGRDAAGDRRAEAYGQLEASAFEALYVRQRGPNEYELGLERSSAEAIEADADGFALVDATSMQTRSTRLAVRYRFSQLGARTLTVRVYGASGAPVRTVMRSVTLR